MAVSTLENRCLYRVAVRPKAFRPAALSLLPLYIRRKLLRLLAAVDIWPLEGCPDFTRGLDMEEVWKERLESHILSCAANVEYKEQSTARESYLHLISRALLLLSVSQQPVPTTRPRAKVPTTAIDIDKISFLLHGTVCDNSPPPFRYVSYQFDAKCIAPRHYKTMESSSAWKCVHNVFSYFLEQSGWHPKVLEIRKTDHVDHLFTFVSRFLGDFLPQMEDISLEVSGNQYFNETIEIAALLRRATAECQCLKSVSIEASYYTLDCIIATFTKSYYGEQPRWRLPFSGPCHSCGYSNLKRVEIRLNHPGYDWEPGEDWGIFLRLQDELEELRLSGFRDNMSDSLSNLLPHLITTRHSLKCVCLDQCEINSNAFETMVKTFLCTPTTHEQTLDLRTCWMRKKSKKTFSFMRGSSLCPKITHQNGELKTLCVPFTANGVCCLPWILDQPNLRLKRLDLTLCPTEEKLMELYDLLVLRHSLLPVPIITVRLSGRDRSSWLPWRPEHVYSQAIKLLTSCPEVREITKVDSDEILVIYSSL